jgi:Leucine-rich repeat (LRR) protein
MENQLTDLDLLQVPGLTGLYCKNNQLTELDVSTNPNLKLVICDQHVVVTKRPDQQVRVPYA